MKACLLQISGYKQLYLDVESVRKKPYDSDNLQHEKLLLKVSFGVLYLELHWKINQAWASKACVENLEAYTAIWFLCLSENFIILVKDF